MTITRIGYPLGAETRQAHYIDIGLNVYDGDEMDLGPENTSPNIYESGAFPAHTGNHAYGVGLSACFGPYIPTGVYDTSGLRMGYWLRLGGFQAGTTACLYVAAHGKTYWESAMIGIFADFTNEELQIRRPWPEVPDTMQPLWTADMPAALIVNDTWNHIGICHKIAEVGGYLTLYINGIEAISLAGDTRLYGYSDGYAPLATHVWGAGRWVNDASSWLGNDAYLDDMYVDSYIDEVDEPAPALRFLWSQCNAAGENAAWTPEGSAVNAENIDERPNDGETTYNRAAAAALRDTFNSQNISLPPNHLIAAVIPMAYAKRTNAGVMSELSLHAFDGLNYADSPAKTLQMDYTIPIWHRFTTQPDASAWDEGDFNLMQFGYRSEGDF